jgi:hypothetical protein
LYLYPFSFLHCIVCPSIYGLWLSLAFSNFYSIIICMRVQLCVLSAEVNW